jgi:AraC-like DNA-binding protein
MRRQLSIQCDTSVVPARDRAEMWEEAASDFFGPLECTPHPGRAFDARMRAGSVGSVRLSTLEVSPHTIRRTPRLAANTHGEEYKVSLLLGGKASLLQDQREAVLQPGDFAIYDCSRPYTMVVNDPFRLLACVLPHEVVGLSPERVGRITATRIPGGDGIAWAMAPFVKRLTELAIRDEMPADEHRVVETVVDLVESLCATALGEVAQPNIHSRAELLVRIRAYVETHLGDPRLTPARIAEAHYVSKRYLHKLFEAEGKSVSRSIRERRLERCRAELADPRYRDDTVTNIGMRWGLMDAAHFSRVFRNTYGCTPSEYRRLHLPDC